MAEQGKPPIPAVLVTTYTKHGKRWQMLQERKRQRALKKKKKGVIFLQWRLQQSRKFAKMTTAYISFKVRESLWFYLEW